MPADHCGMTNFNRSHDAPLDPIDVSRIGRPPRLTMAADDIRELKLRWGVVAAETHRTTNPISVFRWPGPSRQLVLRLSAQAFCAGGVSHRGIYHLTIPSEAIGLSEIAPLHEHQRTRAGLRRIGPHQPALSQQGAE
jgi:hypothetical protein